MRRISVCALFVIANVSLTHAAQVAQVTRADSPPADRNDNDERVPVTLLVQAAMQQGRECVAHGEFRSAVRILEAQLPKINGHAGYLALLEDAYRGYVKELRVTGQNELAQRYLERLAILDPGVMLSAAVRPVSADKETGRQGDKETRKEEERKQPAELTRGSPAEPVVQAGDKEFLARHYYEASGYYQQAFQLDPNLSPATKERWAYCKLHWVTAQLNNPPAGDHLQSLENEAQAALRLAPRLEYGQKVLKAIEEQKQAATSKSRYPIQHRAQKVEGWQVAESANFRAFHLDAALAERALQTAEETRASMAVKWLGQKAMPPWPSKCELYLHPTAEAYCRATGVPGDSPGHSSVGAERNDATRIHSRRIDLHSDEPNLLRAVLPHETTHVVLAGHFGPKPLPRWADEGIAILSEPPDRIERHLRDLPRAHAEGRVFSVAQLLELDDYPGHQFMHTFYGQSAALVQYLSEVRGPEVFASFLRSARKEGYEAALHRHYDFRDYADLEQRWTQSIIEITAGR